MKKKTIDQINKILKENGLGSIRTFVGVGQQEQKEWWAAFKETFTGPDAATDRDIKLCKHFITVAKKRTSSTNQSTTQDIDLRMKFLAEMENDSNLKRAFNKLSRLLPSPYQCLNEIERLEITNIDFGSLGTKKTIKQPVFWPQENLIQYADAILELFPFRHKIIRAIGSPKEDLNDFGKKLKAEGEQNEPKREEVYKQARKIIGEEPVYSFFTDKGWPTADLWGPISRRTDYPVSTVKRWLKKAYERNDSTFLKKSSQRSANG